MCSDEWWGDWYSECQHFIRNYFSGTRYDCMNQLCGLSTAHIHKAPNCPCPRTTVEERKIQNTFRKICEPCRGAEFDRRVGRKAN